MIVTGKLEQAFVPSQVVHDYPRAKSEFIEVEGTLLRFVIRGRGRPVVLIHGNPGSSQDWAKLYSPLASQFCAFAFDRPGHGRSDRPNRNGQVTVEAQAQLLNSALAQLRVERPILVGHSWGAALALIYALSYPEDVSGLVLLAPAAYVSDDGISFLSKIPAWPVIGDLLNALFTPWLASWLVRTDLAKAFAPDKVPERYLSQSLAAWTSPAKVKCYSIDDAQLNASLLKFAPRYPELRMPLTIVTGDSDLIVPAQENALRLADVLPQAKLHIVQKAGHQLPLVCPEVVVEAIGQVGKS